MAYTFEVVPSVETGKTSYFLMFRDLVAVCVSPRVTYLIFTYFDATRGRPSTTSTLNLGPTTEILGAGRREAHDPGPVPRFARREDRSPGGPSK